MSHRARLAALALLTSAAVLPAHPATATTEITTSAAAPCRDQAMWPDGDDAQWFYHCSNAVAYRKLCPAQLHFNAVLDTCDWPENVSYRTRLTAEGATLLESPVAAKSLRARLLTTPDAGDGADPLENARLTFRTTTGETLCVARTNSDGIASCDVAGGISTPAVTLRRGYEVAYAGNNAAQPSQAHGTLER
ncbi:chitin binding peritrophin-A domain-containing protein [Streptomyces noursei]|uniref:chitin binding peritrophin-A domain-containing protein n=1 Tax=Streptomyces noursei TaxID=1971 RepID=UPI00069DFAF0|nr:chitin binding peritrophin-A domain-containing protein [Streptomyces noursei]MCZ0971016.1 chitin binding domain-containing protein [Streptomyces noursei]